MKRYLLFLIMVTLLLLSTACSSKESNANENAAEDKEISLTLMDTPETKEIGKIIAEEVAKQGYKLKPIYMNDIIQPNKIVDSKEAYANFFQHRAYLNQFNEDQGTHVAAAFEVYHVPSGLYSTKHKSLDDVPEGGIVAIPVDPANNGRALFLLQKKGLLKLNEGVEVIHASVDDIVENPLNLKFKEVDQQMLGRAIKDVDLGFLFMSTAIASGISADDALVLEDENDEIAPYTMVVGVHPDNKESEKTEVLRKAFQNERVKKTLIKNYPKIIIPW